ncbi:MAG: hypothetical protein GY726_08725, partial [Proteobacteria bacterium]|nr:hypothetical protein [Pseudomonadota bacterium]
MKTLRIFLLFTLSQLAGGCSFIIETQTSNAAEQLSTTILNHEDPATVSAAIPTLLILMDSYARSDTSSGDAKLSAAKLYGAYAGAFVDEPNRQKTLTSTAFRYAREGSCKKNPDWCGLDRMDNKAFTAFVQGLEKREIDIVYAYAVAWLSYIEAHSDDWNAIADLPKPQ